MILVVRNNFVFLYLLFNNDSTPELWNEAVQYLKGLFHENSLNIQI